MPETPTLDKLLAEAAKDGRVCPQPRQWNDLWQVLPGRRRVGDRWEPDLPLILAAWWHASDGEKQERFRVHLEWAYEHGCAEVIYKFMLEMKPDHWYRG